MALYVLVVLGYGLYSYKSNKAETLRNTDEKLFLVASGIKRSLSDDFHDRAVSKNSIPKIEEHKLKNLTQKI